MHGDNYVIVTATRQTTITFAVAIVVVFSRIIVLVVVSLASFHVFHFIANRALPMQQLVLKHPAINRRIEPRSDGVLVWNSHFFRHVLNVESVIISAFA